MKLMSFDIELAQLALFAGTGRIVTRGGKEVEITCWNNPVNSNYPIVGKIVGENAARTWTKEGNYYEYSSADFKDLFIEEL